MNGLLADGAISGGAPSPADLVGQLATPRVLPGKEKAGRMGPVARRLLLVGIGLMVAGCGASATALPSPSLAVASPSPAPSPSPSPAPSMSPAASPNPSSLPSPSPPPSAVPSIGACAPATLVARTTLWEGAAGQRIAHVEVTNTGPTCTLPGMAQPQLVEGHGAVLINGALPATSALLTVGPGRLLKTLVQAGNYCGPAPAAPVTVAFVLAGGIGRVVALPVSATDTSGVPPCLGAPGSAGNIEMHPWAP